MIKWYSVFVVLKLFIFLVLLNINIGSATIITFNTSSICYLNGSYCDLGLSSNWMNNILPKINDDIVIDFSNVSSSGNGNTGNPDYVNLIISNSTTSASNESTVLVNSVTIIGSSSIKTLLVISNVSVKVSSYFKVSQSILTIDNDQGKLVEIGGELYLDKESEFNANGGITKVSSVVSIINNSSISFSGVNKSQLIVNDNFELDEFSKFKVFDEIFAQLDDQPFLFVQGESCSLSGKLIVYFDSERVPRSSSEFPLIQISDKVSLDGTFTSGVQLLFNNDEYDHVKYQLEMDNTILTLEFHNQKLAIWEILIIILSIFIVVGLFSIMIYIINDRRKYYNKIKGLSNNNQSNIYTPLI